MFEGSLVESRGLVASPAQRWTALGSLTVQCAVAGLLIAIPLLRPEVLPMISDAPRVEAPMLRRPPVPPVQLKTAANASTAASLPAAAPAPVALGPSIWPHPIAASDDVMPTTYTTLQMGPGGSAPLGVLNSTMQPGIAVVRRKDVGTVRVSRGVSEGMLLTQIRPVYPAIARMAGVQGAVVLEAAISKAGRIESLHAVSGPEMLRKAALDAVAPARYRPYLLNGEPTEVQTTITVVFTLGS